MQCIGTMCVHREELFIIMDLQMHRCFNNYPSSYVQAKDEYSHLNIKLVYKNSYLHLGFADGMKLKSHPCEITVQAKCSPPHNNKSKSIHKVIHTGKNEHPTTGEVAVRSIPLLIPQ